MLPDLLRGDAPMSRVCATCRKPFTVARPAVEAVRLRTLPACRAVPTLRVVAWGSRCAACAGVAAARPGRAP